MKRFALFCLVLFRFKKLGFEHQEDKAWKKRAHSLPINAVWKEKSEDVFSPLREEIKDLFELRERASKLVDKSKRENGW